MKATYKSAIFAIILLITFFSAVDVAARTAAEIFEKASRSVVVVRIYDEKGKAIGLGSGVVLPSGDVATNFHVVEKATGIKVHQGGKDYDAVLRYSDRDRDVCSLSVAGMKTPTVTMGNTKKLKVGSRVYAIGTPKGLELTLSEGIISGLRSVEGGQYLQITAPISPGSSGGGLFDEEGRLIGLTTFYMAEGQQLNFAVPVEWIGELPRQHRKRMGVAEPRIDRFSKAMVLAKKEDWVGLKNHSIRWTTATPLDADAWYFLGDAYCELEQYAEAIEAYQQALRIKPEDAMVWTNLGLAYADSGQIANAIKAYQQALRLNPEWAVAWRSLGGAYRESGQLSKAIEAYQRALRSSPEWAGAWRSLGAAYIESDQFSKAIEACQQSVRLNPEYAAAWQCLGFAYRRSGQFSKAIEAYQQALRIKPEDATLWYLLGSVYNKSGQKEQVMQIYRRLKTLDPAEAEEFFNNVVLP